jgi:glycogen debranching enzyme
MDRPVAEQALGDAALRERVRALLRANMRKGYSKLLDRHYCYVAPAPGTYPFQWFWDTCFHAIMLARLAERDLAQRNLRSLFEMQEDDGFVGHMIFWKQVLPVRSTDVFQARPSWRDLRPHMSAIVQPCFAATALRTMFETFGDRVYLGEMYAKVRRLHEWLAARRDFDGDGLLAIITPFESGMDWKPSYDEVIGYKRRKTPTHLWSELYLRGVAVDFANFVARYELDRIRARERFIVKDAGFNAIYAADLVAMEALAREIGDDAGRFARRRQRVVDAMLQKMYDPATKAFHDLSMPGDRKLPVLTPTIFFPLAIPEVPQDIARAVVEAHLLRCDGFRVPCPLPSVEVRDASFCPAETPFLWRGPTWVVNDWFVHRALRARGFDEQARTLRETLRALVERSGFREYYDPFTGEGHGAHDFTWSGLLVDMEG